jgi:hypothetical protein
MPAAQRTRRAPKRDEDPSDLVIANPDLSRAPAPGSGVQQPDPGNFRGGGSKGYIDDPALAA